MSHAVTAYHPSSWLRELSHLNPARWRWGRSFRAGLGIGLPLAIGLATGTLDYTLWIAMGTLFQSVGERDGPYRAIFHKILISAPIGASGYLLGYLHLLPWGTTVAILVLLAFLSGIISTYSASLSTGALQFLVMGAVAIGNPEIGQFWHASLLLLCGTALYAAMLGIEVLVYPQRPRQEMTLGLLQAMAALARRRAEGGALEEQRQLVTARLSALYGLMLQDRFHAMGRNQHLESAAMAVQRFDVLFPILMSAHDATSLKAAASALERMATAYASGGKRPALEAAADDQALGRAIVALGDALWGKPVAASLPPAQPGDTTPKRPSRLEIHFARLNPGRTAILSSLALALCIGIGYSLYWIDEKSHWYWVPMTIAIIMKPDLGSIFARAIHRSAGTVIGVVIGAAILAFVPVGPLFILLISLIAMCLPWCSQRSYAMAALALTPLVLVLIDFVSPETKGVHYALLRLVDTLLAAGIVLVFGYLIWPRSHGRELSRSFHSAREAIATYLQAVLPSASTTEQAVAANAATRRAQQAGGYRRSAYGQLADMRAALQKSLAEPPPAGREAIAWYPLVTSAERMCDAITAYSTGASAVPDPDDIAALKTLAEVIAADRPSTPTLPQAAPHSAPETVLIDALSTELDTLRELSAPNHAAS